MLYVQKILKYGINKMDLFYQIKNNKFFWFGFLIKITAIIFLAPVIQDKWFIKFISFTIENFSFDPWTNFYNTGQDPLSYPYGPIMLILQLPLSFIGSIIDNLNFASQAQNYFLSIGRLTRQKNQKLLVNLFSILKKENKNFNLYIIGD